MFGKLRYIYRANKYRFRDDRVEIKFILGRVSEGNVAFDIGAHKGGYLYWLRRAAGGSGLVVAFEPQVKLAAYLKQIVEAKKWTNVVIEDIGVSSIDGRMELIIPCGKGDTSPGATFVQKKKNEPHILSERPVISLDNYVRNKGINKVDFIKCDVEGHELDVFKGARNILETHGPTLLFECEGRHLQNSKVTDVFRFLQDLRYRGYFFESDSLKGLAQFDQDRHQKVQDGRFWEAKGYINNFVFEKE